MMPFVRKAGEFVARSLWKQAQKQAETFAFRQLCTVAWEHAHHVVDALLS
jgi:hypothetical protein